MGSSYGYKMYTVQFSLRLGMAGLTETGGGVGVRVTQLTIPRDYDSTLQARTPLTRLTALVGIVTKVTLICRNKNHHQCCLTCTKNYMYTLNDQMLTLYLLHNNVKLSCKKCYMQLHNIKSVLHTYYKWGPSCWAHCLWGTQWLVVKRSGWCSPPHSLGTGGRN